MLIWPNTYIINMLSITVVVYDLLEWVIGSKALEKLEGLDPTRMTSNVGPPCNTSSSYFSSLSIRTSCLHVSLWCMPSALLGFSTQYPRVILPVTELVTSLGKTFLFFLYWVVSSWWGSIWLILCFYSVCDLFSSRASSLLFSIKPGFFIFLDWALYTHFSWGTFAYAC